MDHHHLEIYISVHGSPKGPLFGITVKGENEMVQTFHLHLEEFEQLAEQMTATAEKAKHIDAQYKERDRN
jgi:hypothetical protein